MCSIFSPPTKSYIAHTACMQKPPRHTSQKPVHTPSPKPHLANQSSQYVEVAVGACCRSVDKCRTSQLQLLQPPQSIMQQLCGDCFKWLRVDYIQAAPVVVALKCIPILPTVHACNNPHRYASHMPVPTPFLHTELSTSTPACSCFCRISPYTRNSAYMQHAVRGISWSTLHPQTTPCQPTLELAARACC
jgi:hypothetical protein